MTDASAGIDALLAENRIFPPSESTKRDALVTGTWMYDEAAEDYQGFWAKQAGEPSELAPESLPAEHPLFILYTSGTTGKPKGIVHTTGGYLLGAHLTTKYIFDIRDDDLYWCTADIGWVTGHSYIVYGPLANGATSVIYEGTPDTPRPELREGENPGAWSKDRLWDIIERYKVTQPMSAVHQ